MILEFGAVLALSQRCAPSVAPETLLSVVRVESRFDPLTIGVNGPSPRALHPPTKAKAIALARQLIASGANIDLGLGQINSRNLKRLGMSVSDAFEPCANLSGSAAVLAANYAGAAQHEADQQSALRVALSVYNTGDPARGFRNGYVGRVGRAAREVVPAIQLSAAAEIAPEHSEAAPAAEVQSAPADRPRRLDVFARARDAEVFVFGGPHRRAQSSDQASSSGGIQ